MHLRSTRPRHSEFWISADELWSLLRVWRIAKYQKRGTYCQESTALAILGISYNHMIRKSRRCYDGLFSIHILLATDRQHPQVSLKVFNVMKIQQSSAASNYQIFTISCINRLRFWNLPQKIPKHTDHQLYRHITLANHSHIVDSLCLINSALAQQDLLTGNMHCFKLRALSIAVLPLKSLAPLKSLIPDVNIQDVSLYQ
jgi:hypothetical protein